MALGQVPSRQKHRGKPVAYQTCSNQTRRHVEAAAPPMGLIGRDITQNRFNVMKRWLPKHTIPSRSPAEDYSTRNGARPRHRLPSTLPQLTTQGTDEGVIGAAAEEATKSEVAKQYPERNASIAMFPAPAP